MSKTDDSRSNQSAALHVHARYPIAFLLGSLPGGIAQGFLTITWPFMARRAGLSVATVSSIIAIGLLPLTLMVTWSPLIDFTLTYKRWCRIGASTCAVMLVILGGLPIRLPIINAIAMAAFALMVSGSLIGIPLSGLMAYGVPEELKGRAAGFFQAGLSIGIGMGGGAGLWLAVHADPLSAVLILALVSVTAIAGLGLAVDPPRRCHAGVRPALIEAAREFWDIVRRPAGAIVIALVVTPIGLGAATNLWSSIADEWHASANTVALVTGVVGAWISAAGCALGGWWADRTDRRRVFLTSGGILTVVGAMLALTPRTPAFFAVGTLSYAMAVGMCNAAFSALALATIGRGAAATKYTIITSLGNLPTSYMTAFDGWVHDRTNAAGMLLTEAAVCLLAIGVAAVALNLLPPFESSGP